MKIVEEDSKTILQFPARIRCIQAKDGFGLSYGDNGDFCGRTLEIETADIKKHKWYKYPSLQNTDYGVVCPACGAFIVMDGDEIPRDVKDGAEEIWLESRKETYVFSISLDIEVGAVNLSRAVELLHAKYPGIGEDDIKQIRSGGRLMGLERSSITGSRIWYSPGCGCGRNDCIHDPMRSIAMDCRHQFDIEGQQESCAEPVPDEDGCCNYNSKTG